mmetsp:Transcript_5363/g.12952  ORF Transcript_5363/g.12952 Transcript_5363/m.12952 type:complete len:110 (-) Transcript_5363:189-518(-)
MSAVNSTPTCRTDNASSIASANLPALGVSFFVEILAMLLRSDSGQEIRGREKQREDRLRGLETALGARGERGEKRQTRQCRAAQRGPRACACAESPRPSSAPLSAHTTT